MEIDRQIARRTPIKEPAGDRVPVLPENTPAIARREVAPVGDKDQTFLDSQTASTYGPASLENGNVWNGYPQIFMESRADAQTVIDHEGVSGGLDIFPAQANIHVMNIDAPVTITFNLNGWPLNSYPRNIEGSKKIGLEIAIVLQMHNLDGHNIYFPGIDSWAPHGYANRELNKPGYYEIGFAIRWFQDGFPNQSYIRGFPAIIPE